MLFTVDIGTSNFKSAVWDFRGNRTAFSAIPLPSGLCETDSGFWLKAFEDSCAKIGAAVPLGNIEALVISGNGPSLTPVLQKNKEQRTKNKNAVSDSNHSFSTALTRLWMDRRAEEAAWQVSEYMGGFVDAGFFSAQSAGH